MVAACPYKVGDQIRVKAQWARCELPIGATGTVLSVRFDCFKCRWCAPNDRVYLDGTFGGALEWFELADGPW